MSDIGPDDEIKSKRDARRWVRQHWAAVIRNSDWGAGPDNEHLQAVWDDECDRIAERLAPGVYEKRA